MERCLFIKMVISHLNIFTHVLSFDTKRRRIFYIWQIGWYSKRENFDRNLQIYIQQQTQIETEDRRIQENSYDAEGLRYDLIENGKRTRFIYHNGELLYEEEKQDNPKKKPAIN